MTTQFEAATLPPPDKSKSNYIVTRDGDRDLAFEGWLLSEGIRKPDILDNMSRGTSVRIYLTTGRRLVTAVRQWTQDQGGKVTREVNRAAVHTEPEAALSWLRA